MISSGAMSRREKSEDDPVPTETYIQLLKQYCDELGITWKSVGMSEMTYARLFRLGKPTVSAANRYAQAVRERGVDMPPADVPVIDAIDHEWIVLGRELRQANKERFDEILQILREFGHAARATTEATARLRNLVGTGTTNTDTVPGGGGVK